MIFEKLICVKVNKISTEIKVHLNTLDSNRSETFPLGLHWGCTHCSWYFGQFFREDLLKRCDVLGMLLGNTDFQLPLRFSNKFRFQGVARPLKILKSFFLLCLFFVAQAVCLESLSCWKIQSCVSLNSLTDGKRAFFVLFFVFFKLTIYCHINPLLNTDQSTCTDQHKSSSKACFHPHASHWVFLGCKSTFFPLQTQGVYHRKFHLVPSNHITLSPSSFGLLRWSLELKEHDLP